MQTIRINYKAATESGRRRGWGKVVTSVDSGKTNGYAFEGTFLQDGECDLPIGTVVVEMVPGGSIQNSRKMFRAATVRAEGVGLEDAPLYEREQFLSFRDYVAELVAEGAPVDREALQAERERLLARIAEIDALLANGVAG